MSIPGRQEQTLVYRVELDESSVANIIRTARESVGVGLQQATSMGNSVTSQGQLTTATAIAQVGSHLEFLERTRSALGAPASMADSAAGMGIARALGVQAGIVQPGFNELGSDMKRRASTALGGQYSTTGLSVASGVASAGLMAAGIGLAIAFPPSIPVMIGLGAVEMAADAGISTGFDRAISRTQMAGHLRRFGVGKSFAIAEQFERDAGMLQGSYGEMADVAKATLTSVRFQPGDNVNGALMGAIGDYRIAGKLLNMDKEQALGTVQEMYRAGMSPGQAAGYFGSVSGLSQRMGYDPAALHARALDFGRSATVGGYGAFDSMNQYMIQSSMVGQMVRSGAMNRGMLTAAAGFAGPEGEQVMGAAKNMMTQMLGFQQSGMGRGIMAGLMSGGTGDLNNLMSSAAGMSTQDILSFGGQKPGMALLASSQDALMNAAATAVKAAGGTVDVATMTSAIRSIGGMDFGVAQAMATGYMNPGNRGIAQYSGEIREIGARSETMGQPGAIGRLGGLAARGAGNFITNMWSGGSGPGMTADIERSGKWNNTVRNVIGDSEVHGLQGALQVAGL
jgi:urease beta subunit